MMRVLRKRATDRAAGNAARVYRFERNSLLRIPVTGLVWMWCKVICFQRLWLLNPGSGLRL